MSDTSGAASVQEVMSSFISKKLDIVGKANNNRGMPRVSRYKAVAAQIRERIEAEGERFWTYGDFEEFPLLTTAKALSRLAAEGRIIRTSKGRYYHPRQTAFGTSRPPKMRAAEISAVHKLHPSGISAANLLGFTTQNAGRTQYATTGPSAPTKLAGSQIVTRRPQAREDLSLREGAFLEFLRTRGALSEYPPEETARMLIALVKEELPFPRLAAAALTEPPRVRAILGAIGEEAGQPAAALKALRESLNPLSRFDFGPLRVLKHAKMWQAK